MIFRINLDGTESLLHVFTGNDGFVPTSPLVMDPAGNLYGTTAGGGSHGSGTVFALDALGQETVLYNFTGGYDGQNPVAGLIRDAEGNLYGMTSFGGLPSSACGQNGGLSCGTAFRISASGVFHVLYQFSGGTDGGNSYSGLIFGKGGLYGTTLYGGNLACNPPHGCGTVFQITGTGQKKVIHAFAGHWDGSFPEGNLLQDKAGNIYGTTSAGGTKGKGIVFKIKP